MNLYCKGSGCGGSGVVLALDKNASAKDELSMVARVTPCEVCKRFANPFQAAMHVMQLLTIEVDTLKGGGK